MSSLTKAGVAIRKSNGIGMSAAVYVCNGRGELSRKDYRTVAEARRIAADVRKQTGWAIHEDLKTEGASDHFGGSALARGVAAVPSTIGGRASTGSLVLRVAQASKKPTRK